MLYMQVLVTICFSIPLCLSWKWAKVPVQTQCCTAQNQAVTLGQFTPYCLIYKLLVESGWITVFCCIICPAANHCTTLGTEGKQKGPMCHSVQDGNTGNSYEKDKVLSHTKAGDREGRLFKALHTVWPHGSDALLHSRLSHLMISKLFL